MSDPVRVDIADWVETIRFDRPEHQNALSGEMLDAAANALVLGEGDPRVRVFLLAGSPGAFSAGTDIEEIRRFKASGIVSPSLVRFLKTLATVEKPLVAAVDGLAIGTGVTMLLHCDFVVASEWAEFTIPQSERGLPPEGGATLLAPRMMGLRVAFELIALGESFDAARAREIGLVNRVVAAELVEETALAMARKIAGRPPEAVRLARLMMRGDRRDVVARIAAEAAAFPDLQRSREAQDAFQEFLAGKP